jgi:hypothetical protein
LTKYSALIAGVSEMWSPAALRVLIGSMPCQEVISVRGVTFRMSPLIPWAASSDVTVIEVLAVSVGILPPEYTLLSCKGADS